LKQSFTAQTGASEHVAYKRLPLLQVIRHLPTPALARASFAGPVMRAFLLAASILVAWKAPKAFAAKEEDRANAVAQIRFVLRAQQDAWNRGDIDGFMNGYARSASTVFISEDTVRRGWETVRARYREKYSNRAKMGVLTFSALEITLLSPDSAVVLGRWKLQRSKDRPHGRFTLIFKRLPEGWRIVHDHTAAAK
jgi:ketosteroid isomerase-like protein